MHVELLLWVKLLLLPELLLLFESHFFDLLRERVIDALALN